MDTARAGAAAVLGLRIAYGIGLVAAPRRLAERWLGRATRRAPTQVALRALGMREIVLHTGGALALGRGAPLRPWLAASAAGDLTDVVSTIAARQGLPAGSPAATAAVGGGAAALSLALAGAVKR